jgi:hypothetical protein
VSSAKKSASVRCSKGVFEAEEIGEVDEGREKLGGKETKKRENRGRTGENAGSETKD